MRKVKHLLPIVLNCRVRYKRAGKLPARALVLVFLLGCGTAAGQAANWREQGVLHLDGSPEARLKSVPVGAVEMGEGFWQQRRRVTLQRSIPTLLELLEANGVLDNFRRLAEGKPVARRGPLYTDSDLYKWMEAAAFFLQTEQAPELEQKLDELTGLLARTQEPSGYLNTYYVEDRQSLRWQEMHRGHELYCLGHLLQAGIAYYRARGKRALLEVGIRFADHLTADFGPGKQPLLAGHPEIELALVELYRTTGEKKYLQLAGYILTGDERLKLEPGQIRYMFSGIPFPQRTRLEGHAVRAMYAASGATDYYLETGDAAYWRTLRTLFEDLVGRKMYITGGVGSRATGEAFGEPYELPNQLAYTESCAAIGSFFWNWRMLQATGDAAHADVMERTLYNGINSGMSLNGTLYCYRNPLELSGNPEDKIRNPWYTTTCCPPNLQRVFASLPGYFYSTSAEGIYVHFFDNNTLRWKLADGTRVELEQRTQYPWKGEVTILLRPEQEKEFTLYVRVPAWSKQAGARTNGGARQSLPAGSYAALRRKWKAGDRVELMVDMTPRVTAAHPRVADNVGKVAVERGPLVYAMEGEDQPEGVHPMEVRLLRASGRNFREEYRADVLGGVTVLRHAGLAPVEPTGNAPLYQPLEQAEARPQREVELTLIPYYAFANRAPTPMRVWIPWAWQRGAEETRQDLRIKR